MGIDTATSVHANFTSERSAAGWVFIGAQHAPGAAGDRNGEMAWHTGFSAAVKRPFRNVEIYAKACAASATLCARIVHKRGFLSSGIAGYNTRLSQWQGFLQEIRGFAFKRVGP